MNVMGIRSHWMKFGPSGLRDHCPVDGNDCAIEFRSELRFPAPASIKLGVNESPMMAYKSLEEIVLLIRLDLERSVEKRFALGLKLLVIDFRCLCVIQVAYSFSCG